MQSALAVFTVSLPRQHYYNALPIYTWAIGQRSHAKRRPLATLRHARHGKAWLSNASPRQAEPLTVYGTNLTPFAKLPTARDLNEAMGESHPGIETSGFNSSPRSTA
jgi:hypothetical protein